MDYYILLKAGVFCLSLLCGYLLIPYIKRLRLGQHERLEGPGSHLAKEGTPTFGGFIFLLPFFAASVLLLLFTFWHKSYFDRDFAAFLLTTAACAALGFYDDYVKVRVDREGLSPRRKSIYLLLIFAAYACYFCFFSQLAADGDKLGFTLPFFGFVAVQGLFWRALFALFLLFYLYCCANAVNITDGVDGLCSSVTIAFLLTFVLMLTARNVSYRATSVLNWYHSAWFLILALAAFLFFNWHPAKIFMGDLGSLALGAAAAIYLLQFSWLFAFLFVGFIYWIEILSVLIQVTYYKKTGGKRIFKMTPIHHHFELSNWSEIKIVVVFTALTCLGGLLSYMLFV